MRLNYSRRLRALGLDSCHVRGPIGIEDHASWVWRHRVTWGVGGANGTVPVRSSVREKSVGVMGVLAGISQLVQDSSWYLAKNSYLPFITVFLNKFLDNKSQGSDDIDIDNIDNIHASNDIDASDDILGGKIGPGSWDPCLSDRKGCSTK
nr:uncharacterized protein ycf2 [Tanacetum cinerariifolium]